MRFRSTVRLMGRVGNAFVAKSVLFVRCGNDIEIVEIRTVEKSTGVVLTQIRLEKKNEQISRIRGEDNPYSVEVQ